MPRRVSVLCADLRITQANDRPIRSRGDHVLYWMIAARRASWSFALDHALALAKQLGRPLLVLEALRVGYRWASDRLHRFVLDGMADNARASRRPASRTSRTSSPRRARVTGWSSGSPNRRARS